jgi:hypothetical protein
LWIIRANDERRRNNNEKQHMILKVFHRNTSALSNAYRLHGTALRAAKKLQNPHPAITRSQSTTDHLLHGVIEV